MAQDPELQEFTTAATSLTNYDFVDSATQTGYLSVWLIAPTGGAGASTVSDFNGYNMYVTGGVGTENFDLLINAPVDVRGTAYAQIAVDPSFNNCDLTVAIYKWDGTSETEIGTSSTYNIALATTKEKHAFSITCADTHIADGEYIRLKVTTTQINSYILCDPSDSSVTTPNGVVTSTQSKFLVPLRVDI